MGLSRRIGVLVAVTAIGALGTVGCTSTPDSSDVASISSQGRVSAPVALALARALEVETGGALPDGVVPRRLEKLRLTLTRGAGAKGGAIHVLATHQPRLQALPQGRLAISRGLLAALAVPDPRQPLVVAVLAHEVAYASLGYPQADLLAEVRRAGHGRLGASIAPLVSAGSIAVEDAASLAAARDVVYRPPARDPAGLARRVAADRLAVRLVARMGYQPQVLVRAWQRIATLQAHDPAAYRAFTALHGSGAERVRSARIAAADMGRLPARREGTYRLELARLVLADRHRALLEAAGPLARAGRAPALERLLEGDAGLRAEGTWLDLQARHVLLSSASEADAEAKGPALESDLRRLLLRAPLHAQARLLLAKRYLAANRRPAAREELHLLVARSPLWAEAQLLLAQATPDVARARQRARLAQALDTPGGRVAETARRFLAGEGKISASAPSPDRDRGGRRLLGGGR